VCSILRYAGMHSIKFLEGVGRMKVLGIAASPRRGGNSEILLDRALEGARTKGAEVEKVVIADLKIAPCDGRSRCWSTGRCHIKDDMQPLYKKLHLSDLLVVSSPVYFGSVTAQLKTVIDRCQSIWVKNFILNKRPRLRKRKGLFISVSGHENRKFFRNQKEIIKLFYMVLGVEFSKALYIPAVDRKKDILKDAVSLGKAFRSGARLIK